MQRIFPRRGFLRGLPPVAGILLLLMMPACVNREPPQRHIPPPRPPGTANLKLDYFAPEWGPDGEWIYYIKQATIWRPGEPQGEGRTYFGRIRPDGTEDTEIFELWPERSGNNFVGGHIWSATMDIHPGRRRAVVSVLETRPRGMFTFNLDGSDFRKVWPQAYSPEDVRRLYWHNHACWSPDGEWIAFEERGHAGAGQFRICKVREDGSEYTVVYPPHRAQARTDARLPAWNPKDDRIAFMRHEEGFARSASRAYMIRANGSDLQRIPAAGHSLEWSPDGEYLMVDGGLLVGESFQGLLGTGALYGGKSRSAGNLPKWGPRGWVGLSDEGVTYMDVPGHYLTVLRRGGMTVPAREVDDPRLRLQPRS